jgi:hypothetical protein
MDWRCAQAAQCLLWKHKILGLNTMKKKNPTAIKFMPYLMVKVKAFPLKRRTRQDVPSHHSFFSGLFLEVLTNKKKKYGV